MKKILMCSVCLICLCGCDPYRADYFNAKSELEILTSEVNNIVGSKNNIDYKGIIRRTENLEFKYDKTKVRNKKTIAAYEQLCSDIAELKINVPQKLESSLMGQVLVLARDEEYLMEGVEVVNLYASRGDTIIIKMTFESPSDVKLYNADSKKLIKSFIGKTVIDEAFPAPNTAIYIVEMSPCGIQYVDRSVAVSVSSLRQYLDYKVVNYELVPCNINDFRAIPVEIIQTQDIFDEPRKHTLRSGIRSLFSGSDRAIVAVEVPYGATDILYSLRISTSKELRETDGKFKNNTDLTYRKIKFLGLPVYDSSRGSGIISQILNDNIPYREEEAYCSMYIFYNDAQAKKFQDGSISISDCAYDVKNSRVGTQSCNGRISAKGRNVIYFGFLNETMRDQNYIWFEALASVSKTEYYNAKYNLVEPEIN